MTFFVKFSKEIDSVLNVGWPLHHDIGIRNWALTKCQALNALEYFLNAKIPVLGGDVYENIDGIIQPNYDNWHCNSRLGETRAEFAIRSIEKGSNYINRYNVRDPKTIFFGLDPDPDCPEIITEKTYPQP